LANFIRQNNYDAFKKEKNFVSLHHARNNFFIYVHNVNGKIIYQSTNGLAGYRGPKKPTTFAAEINGRRVAKAIKRSNLSPLVLVIRTRLTSFVRSAIKGINYVGIKFNYVRRVILKGHNGLRKPGLRRV
jgi:ribosomal protein S11